jgi:hypothetical protein
LKVHIAEGFYRSKTFGDVSHLKDSFHVIPSFVQVRIGYDLTDINKVAGQIQTRESARNNLL